MTAGDDMTGGGTKRRLPDPKTSRPSLNFAGGPVVIKLRSFTHTEMAWMQPGRRLTRASRT
jgi:hypothetical protein